MVLEIISVFFYRNKRLIFDNFNLKLKNSQIMILIGSNGIGKTTLFELIVGILEPQKGIIKINNQLIQKMFEKKRKNFTYLPHKDGLKDNLTIIENIENWNYLSASKYDFVKLKSSLDYFDLFKIKDENVGNLSQGQRKKVSLSKLILSNNLLWLLDEPFNGLDSDSIIKTKRILENHRKNGGSVLLSSHIDVKIKSSRKIVLNKLRQKRRRDICEINSWEEL